MGRFWAAGLGRAVQKQSQSLCMHKNHFQNSFSNLSLQKALNKILFSPLSQKGILESCVSGLRIHYTYFKTFYQINLTITLSACSCVYF